MEEEVEDFEEEEEAAEAVAGEMEEVEGEVEEVEGEGRKGWRLVLRYLAGTPEQHDHRRSGDLSP